MTQEGISFPGRMKTALRNILNIAGHEAGAMLREPVYYVLLVAATAMIFFSKDFTLFTFDWGSGGDPSYQRTMVREMGLASIFLVCTFLAVITASRSVYLEIERKTALALLGKPVSRRDFILGKYFGIVGGILPLCLFLAVVLVLAVRFQSAQEVREQMSERIVWDFQVLRGVYLNFLKTAVLAALAVALSTRLPFLPTLLAVFTVFVVCHLLNFLNSYLVNVRGVSLYVVQFIYAVLLNLENYNYFYHGDPRYLPSAYLMALVTLYSAIYTCVFLVAADMSFSRRDLS